MNLPVVLLHSTFRLSAAPILFLLTSLPFLCPGGKIMKVTLRSDDIPMHTPPVRRSEFERYKLYASRSDHRIRHQKLHIVSLKSYFSISILPRIHSWEVRLRSIRRYLQKNHEGVEENFFLGNGSRYFRYSIFGNISIVSASPFLRSEPHEKGGRYP